MTGSAGALLSTVITQSSGLAWPAATSIWMRARRGWR